MSCPLCWLGSIVEINRKCNKNAWVYIPPFYPQFVCIVVHRDWNIVCYVVVWRNWGQWRGHIRIVRVLKSKLFRLVNIKIYPEISIPFLLQFQSYFFPTK